MNDFVIEQFSIGNLKSVGQWLVYAVAYICNTATVAYIKRLHYAVFTLYLGRLGV